MGKNLIKIVKMLLKRFQKKGLRLEDEAVATLESLADQGEGLMDDAIAELRRIRKNNVDKPRRVI